MGVRSHQRAVTFSLWGASVALACVVPDVDLVDQLPSHTAGKNQGGSAAGKASQPAGGDGTVVGGESFGGTDSGGATGGRGGTVNGGSSAGTAPGTAGTAGSTAGSSSVGGGPTDWVFSGKGACDAGHPTAFCDDFEGTLGSAWPAGKPWTTPSINDAPSGSHAMRTGFHAAPMGYSSGVNDFNLSFWVRFPTKTDQAFITWTVNGIAMTFGLEASSFRFRREGNPAVVAPELDQYTRGADVDTWTCVEIENVGSTFETTVTAFGDAPVKLATLGGTADAGIDKSLLDSVPGKMVNVDQAIWALGDPGTDIEIDDVRVVSPGEASVCKDFLDANQ